MDVVLIFLVSLAGAAAGTLIDPLVWATAIGIGLIPSFDALARFGAALMVALLRSLVAVAFGAGLSPASLGDWRLWWFTGVCAAVVFALSCAMAFVRSRWRNDEAPSRG